MHDPLAAHSDNSPRYAEGKSPLAVSARALVAFRRVTERYLLDGKCFKLLWQEFLSFYFNVLWLIYTYLERHVRSAEYFQSHGLLSEKGFLSVEYGFSLPM